MTNLPRFNLVRDQQKDDWALRNEQGRTVRRFDTKDDATAGGVLKDALGSNGGSVRIHKENGLFQEERTFPQPGPEVVARIAPALLGLDTGSIAVRGAMPSCVSSV